MHETKYKVWCKVTKRFIQDDEDIENRKNHHLGCYALRPDGTLAFFESEEGGMYVEEKENVEIIFSTGLKDKNGKEIYEGDIVKSFWQHDGMTVQDYELIGEIVWGKEIAAFSLDCGNQIIKWLSSYEREELLELEIIGNRYENPELLK